MNASVALVRVVSLFFDATQAQRFTPGIPKSKGKTEYAPVMELVDMRDLGSCAAMRVGSSPFRRTKKKDMTIALSPIGTQCEPMGLNAVYGEN